MKATRELLSVHAVWPLFGRADCRHSLQCSQQMRKKKEGGRERGPGYNGKWIGMTSQRKKKKWGRTKISLERQFFHTLLVRCSSRGAPCVQVFFFFFSTAEPYCGNGRPKFFCFCYVPFSGEWKQVLQGKKKAMELIKGPVSWKREKGEREEGSRAEEFHSQ